MHAPLTAIQLSSLLRTPYQYICSYILPEISQRCKSCLGEMDFAPGVPRRQIAQPKSHCGQKPSRSSAYIFGGCCRDVRQDGEMHFRESKGSRRRAEGKQQAASARGYFEAEK